MSRAKPHVPFMRRALLALLLAAAPAAVWAQVAGPTPGQILAQDQARLNQAQAQMQANQLQQMQQRNTAALAQPGASPATLVQHQQIQQQIDQNMALQQQMTQPGSNPSDISSQLQQYQSQIQQLQQQQPTPRP